MAADSALADSLSERAKFTEWVVVSLRSTDIDHQGHVNNSIHPVLFIDGRVTFIKRHLRPCVAATDMTALVKVTIEYLGEMRYPGEAEIGTLVRRMGRSSVTFGQGMFNENRCVAVAEAVVVLLDPSTRRAKPWPAEAAAQLARFVTSAPA